GSTNGGTAWTQSVPSPPTARSRRRRRRSSTSDTRINGDSGDRDDGRSSILGDALRSGFAPAGSPPRDRALRALRGDPGEPAGAIRHLTSHSNSSHHWDRTHARKRRSTVTYVPGLICYPCPRLAAREPRAASPKPTTA